MLQKVMENVEKRAHACITAKGEHLQDIILNNWLVAISVNWIKCTLTKEVKKLMHFHFIQWINGSKIDGTHCMNWKS